MIRAEVKNLCKSFGKHEVLKNVSFTIHDHEIVGFIGPNGAGKSTTMKCMASLIYPSSGQIIIEGHDLAKERELALQYVSAMIEAPGLFPTLSGYENLQYFARLKHVDQKRIDEVAAYTRLHKNLEKRAGQYSMGMKQRLGLGIALLGHPKFLILDEPTNGLDPRGIMELRQELRQLADEEDVSILISSHQLGEIEKVADRIICINQGEIVETPSAVHNAYGYTFYMQEKDLEVAAAMQLEDAQLEREKLGIKARFRNEKGMSMYLQKLLQQHIEVIDIVKETVDIESIYREVYGDDS
ncbi:ABC transporter ATP-binding protein [[Clostridium] innocuum]|nr:ABC transporter ATP-binding protein [[Clostridium] innocuum]MCR0411950.1 ABC transporter ATP-binding protein [[Clostridium] innocuum]MCR0534815.1 ABC transporter ATP-binding protein [[Clostridium] innocuum]MCR0537571.1 ABC transporter ATP-binding protein [[Clostridium] innocuum]MDU1120516.1 ABC transporter ATP-binding protein [Erysipelotrichaceae bacterium]